MDFYEGLSELLLSQLSLKSALVDGKKRPYITFEPIQDNDKGIALLDAPSTPNLRYLDRSKSYDWMVQVMVKNKNQHQAMLDSHAIYELCDDLPRLVTETGEIITVKSKNKSFELIHSKGYTLPRMIDKTEHNAYIYSFLLKFELYIK